MNNNILHHIYILYLYDELDLNCFQNIFISTFGKGGAKKIQVFGFNNYNNINKIYLFQLLKKVEQKRYKYLVSRTTII